MNDLLQQYCWCDPKLNYCGFSAEQYPQTWVNPNDTIIKWPKCLNTSIQKDQVKHAASVSSIPLRRGLHSIFILDNEVDFTTQTSYVFIVTCSQWGAGEHFTSLPWAGWRCETHPPAPALCLQLAPGAGWGGTGAPWRRCSGDSRSGWRWIFPEEAHPVWHNCTKSSTG